MSFSESIMLSNIPKVVVVLRESSESKVVVSILQSAGLTVARSDNLEGLSGPMVGATYDVAIIGSDVLSDGFVTGDYKKMAKKMVLLSDGSMEDGSLTAFRGVNCVELHRPVYRSELLASIGGILEARGDD